jgi:3',5'-cyclic AMP phosphodiesterase CpdA
MSGNVKTLILRFRDLGIGKGETIKQHKSIIADKGFVWWGWWNKAGETIPDDTFRYLKRKAGSESLSVYLLDSGQKKIYEAKCSNIKWNTSHTPHASPDSDSTPEYYREQKYLTWFKFTEISEEPCEESILGKLTYFRVDNFFEDQRSKYIDFYGKRVFSIDELVQQNRSIWFIRDFEEGDLINEIKLLSNRKIKPSHFTEEYIQCSSQNLLWVSDLHYSRDYHGFPLEGTVIRNKLGLRIEDALKNNEYNNIGGVIVSGDITWKATKEEFKLAESFFAWAKSWGDIDNYQFAICSGNHDIAFSADPSEKGAEITKASDEACAAYGDFYEDLFYQKPNIYLSSGRKFLLGNAIPVEIVCLNSSFLAQEKGLFQGHGFLGQPQLNDAAEQMNWKPDSDPLAFRIAVLHHHLLPVTFREIPETGRQYSVVLDAEAFSQWLVKYRIRLVLHGHMHNPFVSRVVKPISIDSPNKHWFEYYVLGMGSSGVKIEHLGESRKNTIGILKFKKNKVEVIYYQIDPMHNPSCLYSFEIPYEGSEKNK